MKKNLEKPVRPLIGEHTKETNERARTGKYGMKK